MNLKLRGAPGAPGAPGASGASPNNNNNQIREFSCPRPTLCVGAKMINT